MRFLLDTNVVSHAIGPSPNRKLLRKLELHEGHVAIASATWHELRFGAERLPAGRRRDGLFEALAAWRDVVPIVEYDGASAEWHASERARLLALGRTLHLLDGQIAAIAV